MTDTPDGPNSGEIPQPPPPPAQPAQPARPIGELGRAAQIAVGVSTLVVALLAWSQWDRSQVATDFRDGASGASFDDLVSADDRVQLFAGIFLVALLVSGIIFLAWFHRAYSNLVQRGVAKHAAGWAIGAWFVPFLNFWRPAKMTQELLDDGRGEGTNPSGFMWAWWVLFMVGSVLDRGFNQTDTLDNAITSDQMGAVGGIMWVGAGIFLIVLIGQVCTRAATRTAA